ncbi:MAG: TIGR03617 family F420-dependent LLM class oxidoreductase [Dehalococcoidia bacterium]|nr:TIGR03617 family F420-dependent LLM class oxidoreductase [Dehalococcoidia bacterium]
MKIETGFGETWLGEVPARVRAAEAAGFDSISTPEMRHNSILELTLAAEHTERMELCTGVTIAFPRSPMVMAQSAWDLQQFSKGRINIGLGSQVKGHNIRRFGGTWSPPARRMEEYVTMMRAIWRSWQFGERPEFVGEDYRYLLMTPAFNPGPIDYPFPKISIASVGPKMAEVAGAVGDGLRPHGFMTEKYMRQTVLPALEKGARRAGRSLADIEVSVGGFSAFGETQAEVEQAIDALRRPISFYGSTRTYHVVFQAHGLEALGMRLHELSLRGEWDKMLDAVTFEHAAEMANACTYDDLPQYAREHFEYATRLRLPFGDDHAAGRYGGSSDAEGSAPSMSRERLDWLIKELHTVGAE